MPTLRDAKKAGMSFLAEKYGFRVEHAGKRARGEGYFGGPSWHDLFWGPRGSRTLLFGESYDEHDHCEWLHEVAHIVCCPPWEGTPTNSAEFCGIFPWERAVAEDFHRRGWWCVEDVRRLYGMQATYSLGDTAPMKWDVGMGEWGGLSARVQEDILRHGRRLLRKAGLLYANGRPTYTRPVWHPSLEAPWRSLEMWEPWQK
jgi:hypothetical protein